MRLKKQNGFTMMELLIVTVIIGLIAAMAVPDFVKSMQKLRWHGTGTDVMTSLRLARSYAISQQRQFGVVFDTSSNHITVFKDLVNPTAFTFEYGDSVVAQDSIEAKFDWFWASFTSGAVCFFPNGRASESGYIMASQYSDELYQMLSISVLAATGRVAIDYVEN
ncbi:MAG: GspH/FimT family pseudopilin [candidate division Zixibacteria bacterium]|nr:GspH/FimT family pseudopilin [candidate division Zixibacteria bacterium]